MVVKYTALIFLLLGFLVLGCHRPATEPPVLAQNKIPETIQSARPGYVNFKGVSFNYDPKVFGNVKQTEVEEHRLEDATDKPDYAAPKHIAFTFDFGPRYWAAFLEIYPVDQFPRVYAVNPDYMPHYGNGNQSLKKSFEGQGLPIQRRDSVPTIRRWRPILSNEREIVSISKWQRHIFRHVLEHRSSFGQ